MSSGVMSNTSGEKQEPASYTEKIYKGIAIKKNSGYKTVMRSDWLHGKLRSAYTTHMDVQTTCIIIIGAQFRMTFTNS